MGKHFGNLQKIKGVTYYVLSPHELKPFKGMLNPGLMNTVRRYKENFFYMGVPFLIGFMIYDYATKEYHRLSRKNPDDYKDEV